MSIHTILSQEIEKLMNKMGTDHRIFMLADGKTRNDLENTIRTFAARIVEEVGEELKKDAIEIRSRNFIKLTNGDGYNMEDFDEGVNELLCVTITKLQKMKESK